MPCAFTIVSILFIADYILLIRKALWQLNHWVSGTSICVTRMGSLSCSVGIEKAVCL